MRREALVVIPFLLLVSCGGPSASAPLSTASPSPSASPAYSLTAADRAAVAKLEARPLRIPAPAKDGTCVDGPHSASVAPYAGGSTETNLYGNGPVYSLGSPVTPTTKNAFFDVTYFTTPTVHGVVLVRIEERGGLYKGFFAGPLGVGKVVGTDTVDGFDMTLYSELALPADNPPSNAGAAPGWGIWKVWQGLDKHFKCVGIQFDFGSTTQVITAAA